MMKSESVAGLSHQDALNRLEEFGFNELQGTNQRTTFKIVYDSIKEPMVLLLIGIGLIYIFLGEAEEVYSLLTFLFLILAITIRQDHRTERTLLALKELSSPRAIVLRDGKQLRIPGREVVPDDIVILNEGDRVPADIKILNGGPVSVDESVITGESFPVNKSSKTEDIAFSGTMILKGQALGRVTATGQHTELGTIGKSLEKKNDEATPLQQSARRTVKKLSLLVGIITIFIIVYYGLSRNDFLEGILVGLTLAMAILPNELPAVLLIFLAAGAWRISKRNVLMRKVPAIEALGGITYLCVDKTGTLTQNKMIMQTLWNGEDTLVISELKHDLPEAFHELMEYGILATPRDPYDPMEKAIQQTGVHFLNKTEHLHPQWKISKEYQITNDLLAVSYAWKGENETGFTIGAKGATEAIIDLCHLSTTKAKRIETETIQFAIKGLRVIAVARAYSRSLPEKQHDLEFEFLGLVGFEDPIREDAKAAVRECQEAGVKVLMITGDHPETAKSIAQQIGLENTVETLSGKELDGLSDDDLIRKLKTVSVFCRMKPHDKLRIVSTLQDKGEVVAMTGDGVNDAPALKKAQIGIAMGKRGTDVAREASSVVLLDDNFSSIVASIKIGRRINQNLQEAFSYLLAIHIPITLLSIVPVIFKLPLILLPVHIAFLHLIIEPASTTLFEANPGHPEIMKERPSLKKSHILSKPAVRRSLVSGIILSIAVIGVFSLALLKGLKATDVRGITFTTLILSNLFLILIMCQKRRGRENKNHFKILTLSTIGLLGSVLYIPFFRDLFRFEIMHVHDLIPCLFITAVAAIVISPLYRHV